MKIASDNGERGGSRLNTLVTLLIVGAMIFVLVKVVPPYVNNYQLQDSMQTEAKFALANKKSIDDIQVDIWKKIQDIGIPATQDSIVVTSQQNVVTISVNYTVPINLIVYQFAIPFHPTADNHSI
jgi:hypothetical protein